MTIQINACTIYEIKQNKFSFDNSTFMYLDRFYHIKAKVFPDPVFASAMMSRPDRAAGMHCA